jgi:hypothetical protein
MSARETLMTAIGALLATVPNAVFFRSRQAALARSEGNAILLEPEEERVTKRTQSPALVLRGLTVIVSVLTRGDVPDQVADPYIEQITALLVGDPTLGGKCAQIIEQSTRWSFAEADLTAGVAEIRFDILYQTLASNLVTAQ